MSCAQICGARKSILKAKQLKLPKCITVTDHFTDLIQHGTVDGDSGAIIGDNGKTLLTPMQLDMNANKLAKAMRRLLGYWTNNNPEGDLVIAFCLHTTENIVLMMLSVLKLGGTYLSLATTYPEQTIVRIVGITRPLLIVTESDPQIMSRFDCVKHICEIVPFHEIVEASIQFEDDPNDPVPLESLSPPWRRAACIVLTAGTTGEPHGVRIGHLALLNRLYWQFKAIPYQDGEVLCLSSLLVDAESVAEIFAPLLGGKPLFIIPKMISSKPRTLIEKIKELKISRITSTPSGFTNMLNVMEEIGVEEAREMLSSLRYWIISGDVLHISLGIKFFQHLNPTCLLVYYYGATEITSEATWELFSDIEDFKEKTNDQQVSIGLPLYNNTIYILDEDLNIVPQGTIGEIYISGISLAMGYSDKRDNNTRFVQYPPRVKKSGTIKVFRTGDYGKIANSDGNSGSRLYYQGRIDMIMKIQGREIELNDIAKAVSKTGMCDGCAVLCYHRNREDQAAVAFCVLKEGTVPEAVVEEIKKVLEAFMVPDVYPVTELPYLPSGRLDRQKLLKIYKHRRMESTPDDWKALNLTIAEKQAAKVLFEAISHIIGVSLRFVMANYQSSYWSIGGNSLNALIIFHMCRENGYLISIDEFVLAESLAGIIKIMLQSSRNPVTDMQMLMHICDLAEWKYSLGPLEQQHKMEVINLIAKSHSEKGVLPVLVGVTKNDLVQYLELLWNYMLKENLSLIIGDKSTGEIVAVALCTDVNTKHKSLLKNVSKPMSYCIEVFSACETVVRQTTVNRDRGKIVQIFMLATASSVESRFNIILIEFLLKGSMQKALFHGFSWALIMSGSSLIRDLCGSVLQYDLIAEIKLNSFVAKDKTKPFRRAGDYMAVRAYYRLFA